MYHIGQRWFSEGEPELGLGIVEKLEGKIVVLYFPLAQEYRNYNSKQSPLKRFVAEISDVIATIDGDKCTINELKEQNNIIFYICHDKIIPETQLSPELDLGGPLQRLMAKNFDSNHFFQLRYQAYLEKRHYESFPFKGFLSAKIRLIPHQIYVVSEVLKMNSPKVMLCDEVGLGKTIEASLILNSLIQKEIVESALIVVPESLVNQWFIELYKKFNLSFKTISSVDDDDFNLEELSLTIISSKFLKENELLQVEFSTKKWDLLIIDESHQFNFSTRPPMDEFSLVSFFEKINKNTFGTLLLSATPEVMGAKNLFGQLNFLDPLKYPSYEDFLELLSQSQKISNLIQQKNLLSEKHLLTPYFEQGEIDRFTNEHIIKQALVDRYGTGRNYFRNSRRNLEGFSTLFNQRILHSHPLVVTPKISDRSVFESKLTCVYEILKKRNDEKFLIICHSKNIVLKLQKELMELDNFKLACFHSDQSVLERDRQAAYFADNEGARILISTEIGSEGRNFEFSHHLILFDLPKLPDQLEQRIGRLDRIGQEQNIHIYIPYIKGTFEEILFEWYNEVFNSFESSPIAANEFYEQHKESLVKLIESQFDLKYLNEFIKDMKEQYNSFRSTIENGRDLLIEENSYNDQIAKDILNEIIKYETEKSSHTFMEKVFEAIGIRHEELSDRIYFACPSDNMLIPSYTGLTSEGVSLSYDRELALKYDKLQFLSWEHPLVKNAFELLINTPLGNSTLIKADSLPRNIYFEILLTLFCADQAKHLGTLFLPLTPIRVLLTAESQDKTKNFPKKFIDEKAVKFEMEDMEIIDQLPKSIYVDILSLAHNIGMQRKLTYAGKAIENLEQSHITEVSRVKTLHISQKMKDNQVEQLNINFNLTKQSILSSSLVIDAIRMIIPKS